MTDMVLVLHASTLEVIDQIPDPFSSIPLDSDGNEQPEIQMVWEGIRARYGDVMLAQDLGSIEEP